MATGHILLKNRINGFTHEYITNGRRNAGPKGCRWNKAVTDSSCATEHDGESVVLCSFVKSLSFVAGVCCCGTCPIWRDMRCATSVSRLSHWPKISAAYLRSEGVSVKNLRELYDFNRSHIHNASFTRRGLPQADRLPHRREHNFEFVTPIIGFILLTE
jgi:hypothetical protein